jgi:hypothetical protein
MRVGDGGRGGRSDQVVPTARSRQQDAAFLEGLADRGDPERQRIGVAPASTLPPGNTSAPDANSI